MINYFNPLIAILLYVKGLLYNKIVFNPGILRLGHVKAFNKSCLQLCGRFSFSLPTRVSYSTSPSLKLFYSSECLNNKGTASGTCANGFGVCCVCKFLKLMVKLREAYAHFFYSLSIYMQLEIRTVDSHRKRSFGNEASLPDDSVNVTTGVVISGLYDWVTDTNKISHFGGIR